MRTPWSASSDDATNGSAISAAISGTDDENSWFTRPIRLLHPNKAGTILHLTTGFAERACWKYASGEIRTPGFFIRQLLRSDQGETYLAAFMDDSEARWWRDLQRARRISAAIKEI